MHLSDQSPLFEILPFSEEALAEALSNQWIGAEALKREKYHYHFLLEYLAYEGNPDHQVKTILVENLHISYSYQSDYVAQYALSFPKYSRFCKRVHFFSKDFRFIEELVGESSSVENNLTLWEGYVGFVTVKPLPKARLGTILLKPYPSSAQNQRVFTVIRDYQVSVLGENVILKSLPFQEQDTVVSSCATMALWSAIHMLHGLFQTPLLTPNEINGKAHFNIQSPILSLPGIGLDLAQICRVIEYLGLLPELRTIDYGEDDSKDKSFIKKFIYAYLRMGLPILVGLQFQGIGQHLVTIVGYKKIDLVPQDIETSSVDINVYADQLKEFYAHDDQTGPFSRIKFLDTDGYVQMSRWQDFQSNNKLQGRITSLIAPLPKEVRISFEDIWLQISSFESILYPLIEIEQDPVSKTEQEIIWDIYLVRDQDFKTSIKGDETYARMRLDILNTFFPPFIWIARGTTNGMPSIEFIFDATDIPNAENYCFKILFFDDVFKQLLQQVLFPPQDESEAILYQAVFDEFLNGISEKVVWNGLKLALE